MSEKFSVGGGWVGGGWSSDNRVSKVQVPSPKSSQVLTLDLTLDLDLDFRLTILKTLMNQLGWHDIIGFGSKKPATS